MAISVGSVEVDIVPNTRNIYPRLRAALEPAATRAGEDAGRAAGRSFGPAMQSQVDGIGASIGEQIGRQISSRITTTVRDSLREGVVQGGRAARAAAVRQGDETGGAFSRSLKTRLEAAFRSLPKLEIGANTSEADADLQALRVRMETLASKRIGIDIDAEVAKAEIRLIESELERLGARHPNVQVRADTAAARTQLAAVRAEIEAVDGKRARIDVDTSGAVSALLHLAVAIGGLVALPAIPVLAAGIGAIGSAAIAAAAGVGALAAAAAPAILGIGSALQAQKAAQDAAATSTLRGAQAAGQGASRALQLAGAQQALAAAHRNAARQIGQAEQAVADAVRSSADANRQAAEQVKAARQSLADAVQQAADRQEAAADAVGRAEESLADAQRQARQAQQDLTQARKDAALELAELGDRLTNAQLSERDAVLSVEEARTRLAAVQAKGGRASLVEQQRAQLAYDQAVQRLKEQRAETKRLTDEKKAADKTGVDGSDTVKTAQERLADAERKLAEEQRGLGKARKDAADQQIANQRAIAEAQQKVAEASRNVSRTQEDGARSVQRAQEALVAAQQSAADSIASAQRQIASASQSAAGGIDQAALAQAKYQAALDKLSPAARATFNAFTSLKAAFLSWSEALQPAIMPLFTRALEGVKNSLPGLTPFVLAAASAIKTLQDRVSVGFQSPWWNQFRDELAGAVEPAIVGLGVSFGRVFKGMAGVVDAFLPHMDSISARMQAVTGRFANWGTSLKGSPQFERFLSYSAEQAPIIAEALGDITNAFYQLARATSPLSGPVLKALGAVASAIASIAETLPWLIQLLYAAWVATKLWTLSLIVFNAVMSANPIALVVIGIVALVAAVIYAYKHWGWFRDIVQAAWSGIQAGARFVWSILQPILAGIWEALKAVGTAAMWLWTNAISPAFKFIWTAAKLLFTIAAVLVIGPLVVLFKVLGATAMWLWQNAIKPAFKFIGEVAMWLWQVAIRPQFLLLKAGLELIGKVAKWLWENAIRPAFRAIGEIVKWLWQFIKPIFDLIAAGAKWLWEKGIKPAFDAIKKGVSLVKDAFAAAKDGIGKVWEKIKDLTRSPIKWVIDIVYNKGVVGLWNAAAEILPIGKLKPYKFAEGGSVFGPGTATSDSIPALLSNGEHVWTAAEVAGAGGHSAVEALRRQAVGAYAKGGPVGAHGGVGDWFGGALDKLGSVVGNVKDWVLGGVYTAAQLAAKPIRDLIKAVPGTGNGFGSLVRALPTALLDRALGAIKGSEDKEVSAGGQWMSPVDAPFGTRFGVSGGMWSSGKHTGLDFPAAVGKAVNAVAAGQIASATSGGPYGNHILVNHGNGLQSLYAHLSKMVATSGAVRAGQLIGAVGATGNVTGPHLHLEARLNGTPVDPLNYLQGGLPAPGGSGVGRWTSTVLRALSMLGQPSSNLGITLRRMQQESGGDPNIVNRWDSNWAAGTPSVGLMQLIRGTYQAYSGQFRNTGPFSYGVSVNPLANVFASMRYALARYGSLQAAYGRPGGYDSGGYLQPGLNLAYNGTGRPEPVFTTSQANALTRLAIAPTGGLTPGQEVTLVVQDGPTLRAYVDSRADSRVNASKQQALAVMRAGRKG